MIAEGDPDTLATRGLKEGDRVTVEQIVPWCVYKINSLLVGHRLMQKSSSKTCRYCKSGDYRAFPPLIVQLMRLR